MPDKIVQFPSLRPAKLILASFRPVKLPQGVFSPELNVSVCVCPGIYSTFGRKKTSRENVQFLSILRRLRDVGGKKPEICMQREAFAFAIIIHSMINAEKRKRVFFGRRMMVMKKVINSLQVFSPSLSISFFVRVGPQKEAVTHSLGAEVFLTSSFTLWITIISDQWRGRGNFGGGRKWAINFIPSLSPQSYNQRHNTIVFLKASKMYYEKKAMTKTCNKRIKLIIETETKFVTQSFPKFSTFFLDFQPIALSVWIFVPHLSRSVLNKVLKNDVE